MSRHEMWELYGSLVLAGYKDQANVLVDNWDANATMVRRGGECVWFSDIDPTPWEELLGNVDTASASEDIEPRYFSGTTNEEGEVYGG